jgi:hypothetical protein
MEIYIVKLGISPQNWRFVVLSKMHLKSQKAGFLNIQRENKMLVVNNGDLPRMADPIESNPRRGLPAMFLGKPTDYSYYMLLPINRKLHQIMCINLAIINISYKSHEIPVSLVKSSWFPMVFLWFSYGCPSTPRGSHPLLRFFGTLQGTEKHLPREGVIDGLLSRQHHQETHLDKNWDKKTSDCDLAT